VKNGAWEGVQGFSSRNGTRYHFNFTISFLPGADNKPSGILIIGRDVTRERSWQEELQTKERFYHGLIADSLDGILLMDAGATITFASPSIRHVLGFDFQEVLGKNAFEYVHPEDRLKAKEAFDLEVVQNPLIKFITVRLLCKNGNWLWCLVRGHNLLSNPAVNGIAIYFHDDTLRKQASEALRETEQRFRMLIANLQIGVMLHNPNAEVVLCNEAGSHLLGIPEESFVGRPCTDQVWNIVAENGVQLTKENLPAPTVIRTGNQIRNTVVGYKHPETGERIWLLINADPVFDSNRKLQFVITSFADISERKRLENQLLGEQIAHQRQLTQATIDSSEKERIEIGKELHDNIGQQLTTIKLYLDLARSTADEETLEMVSLATRNVSDVINEIRNLCRSLIPSSLGDLGLQESVNDLIHTLTRTQKVRIRFVAENFDEATVPDNQKLMLFRIVQEQLNNIVKHAHAQKVHVRLSGANGVKLEIADDGVGFDPATVRRGLGLTNMRNRAEMFGGTVEIKSAPGKGCVLSVHVPDGI
jgi:PAS domain S-box-containing protein